MARIPSTTNANGLWTPNDARDAELGEVWPATYVPQWADGYVSRNTSLDGGDTFGNAFFNHWGTHYSWRGSAFVIRMKCANYDWTLQEVEFPTSANGSTAQLMGIQWGIWDGSSGQRVNDSQANALFWSGNNDYYITPNHNGSGVSKSVMLGIGAGSTMSSPVLGTYRMTANTWYVIGGAFHRGLSNGGGGHYYTAYSGGGYTNYRTSTSQQMSGSGDGGVTLTGNFEWNHGSYNSAGHEYFDNNVSYFDWSASPYWPAGPMSAFKVKLHAN